MPGACVLMCITGQGHIKRTFQRFEVLIASESSCTSVTYWPSFIKQNPPWGIVRVKRGLAAADFRLLTTSGFGICGAHNVFLGKAPPYCLVIYPQWGKLCLFTLEVPIVGIACYNGIIVPQCDFPVEIGKGKPTRNYISSMKICSADMILLSIE